MQSASWPQWYPSNILPHKLNFLGTIGCHLVSSWPPIKTAAQKHSVWSAVHPSNLLSNKQALNAWLVMYNRRFLSHCSSKIPKRHFLHLHSISHPGRLASRHLVSSRFVWRSLANDVTSWGTEQDPPPHPPAAAAHPHPPAKICSSPH